MITDGKANGPVDVAEAAAKWKDAVDHIYALGFGDADKEGQKKTSRFSTMLNKFEDIEKIRRDLQSIHRFVGPPVRQLVCPLVGHRDFPATMVLKYRICSFYRPFHLTTTPPFFSWEPIHYKRKRK